MKKLRKTRERETWRQSEREKRKMIHKVDVKYGERKKGEMRSEEDKW